MSRKRSGLVATTHRRVFERRESRFSQPFILVMKSEGLRQAVIDLISSLGEQFRTRAIQQVRFVYSEPSWFDRLRAVMNGFSSDVLNDQVSLGTCEAWNCRQICLTLLAYYRVLFDGGQGGSGVLDPDALMSCLELHGSAAGREERQKGLLGFMENLQVVPLQKGDWFYHLDVESCARELEKQVIMRC